MITPRNIILIKLLFFGGIISLVLYRSYHYDNIFAILFYFGFGSAHIVTLVKALKSDVNEYIKVKKIKSFVLTFIGTISIVVIFSILCYYEAKVNSPTLLKAEGHGVYADFKSNETYVIRSGSWASKTHFYGEYKLRDSILTIDKIGLDDVFRSKRFVIRTLKDPYNKDTIGTAVHKQYLVQLYDAINSNIDTDDLFEITFDNRK